MLFFAIVNNDNKERGGRTHGFCASSSSYDDLVYRLGRVSRRRADVTGAASASRVISSGVQCGFSAPRVRQSIGANARRRAQMTEFVGASAGSRCRRRPQVAKAPTTCRKGLAAAGLGAFYVSSGRILSQETNNNKKEKTAHAPLSCVVAATVVVSVSVRASLAPRLAIRCDNDSLRADELDDGVGEVARLLAAVIVMMAESNPPVTIAINRSFGRIRNVHILSISMGL